MSCRPSCGPALFQIVFTQGGEDVQSDRPLQCPDLMLDAAVQHEAVAGARLERLVTGAHADVASPSFDVSVWEIFMALVAGATLCLGSRDTFFSSERLVEIVRRQGVTVALLPPSLLRVLQVEDFPTLRTIIAVGEKCTTELVEKWSPGRYFFNDYGPAEGSVTVSTYLTDAGATHYHGPPIGRPIANARLYVLDRRMRPVPVGVAGELHLGGVCVARGYLNRPALTAEKFVPDPFGDEAGGRLYKTGDLARFLADGNLQFVGRVDHQEKVRGYRIEMGEIETVLSKHPQVKQCMVLVREDAPGNKRLVAYVIAASGEEPSAAELRAFLKESLPDYMLPSAFVAIETWPLTPNGKVDRAALPKPTAARLEQGGEFLAPQTETERTIAGVLQELLQVEQIGIHDNFFDLGLHSLSAVQAQQKLQELLRREVPVVELFKHPTVESLAKALGRGEGEELRLGDLQERAQAERGAAATTSSTAGGEDRWLARTLTTSPTPSPSSAWRAASPARRTSTSSGATCARGSRPSSSSRAKSFWRKATTRRSSITRPASGPTEFWTASSCSTASSSASPRARPRCSTRSSASF